MEDKFAAFTQLSPKAKIQVESFKGYLLDIKHAKKLELNIPV